MPPSSAQATTLLAPPGAPAAPHPVLLLDLPTELLLEVLTAAGTLPLPLRLTCRAFRNILDGSRRALRLRCLTGGRHRPKHLTALLEHLSQLRVLDCSTFITPTYYFMRSCPLLTSLSLCNSSITPTQLQQLDACPALTVLDLSGCAQKKLNHLPALPSLRSLDLSNNFSIADVSPLTRCPQLSALNCDRAAFYVQDLSPLAALSALSTLTASLFRPGAVHSPLPSCTCLTDLDLSHSSVAVLSNLVGLTRLSHLSLRDYGNLQLDSVHALASLTSLTSLDLSRCNDMVSVHPLAACTRLRTLKVGRCPNLSLQHLALLQAASGGAAVH